MGSISDKLRGLVERGVGEAKDNQAVLVGLAGGAALLGAWSIYSSSSRRSKPSSFELSGGSIAPAELKKEFTDYTASYGESAGEGIKQEHRVNTAELVRSPLLFAPAHVKSSQCSSDHARGPAAPRTRALATHPAVIRCTAATTMLDCRIPQPILRSALQYALGFALEVWRVAGTQAGL